MEIENGQKLLDGVNILKAPIQFNKLQMVDILWLGARILKQEETWICSLLNLLVVGTKNGQRLTEGVILTMPLRFNKLQMEDIL